MYTPITTRWWPLFILFYSTLVTALLQQSVNAASFKYRGVALGGWLVLEPYITPSLFLPFNSSDIPVDEYHFCKQLGPEEALKQLETHWQTFYNQSDFERIKGYGLNMVRIPIGYWAFEKLPGDPYVMGAQKYLDKAIEWAAENDLKVWVDLHGVPGSQNGFDNSGLRNIGYPGWFNHTENLSLTHKVLKQIYTKYGNINNSSSTLYQETVIAIEVVNEPLGPLLDMNKVKQFYSETYKDARELQLINNTIVFHDAFQPMGYWNTFKNLPQISNNITNTTLKNYNILIDHHRYEVFSSGALNETIAQHLLLIESFAQDIGDEQLHHPAVVGEWLAALTDCTPWLNGVGLGSRYEGQEPYTNSRIGDCSNINNWSKWSKEQKKNYRKFVEMQLDQYSNHTQGYIFWTFKTETTIEWDFERLVQYEIMPQPLDSRKYIFNGTDTDKSKSNGIRILANGWLTSVLVLILVCI